MLKKRGQASIEYVLIFGFALMMLMPLIVIYSTQEESIRDDVNIVQARNIVNSVVDNAQKVYFIGSPSKTTINVRMPNNIEDIEITEEMVLLRVRTSDTTIEVFKYSDVNLTGDIESFPGLRKIEIKAYDGFVNISSK